MRGFAVGVVVVLMVGVPALALWRLLRHRRTFATPGQRATYDVLHTASEVAPPLRAGLTREAAQRAVEPLSALLGTASACLGDPVEVLAWFGPGDHHAPQVSSALIEKVLRHGRAVVVDHEDLPCAVPGCMAGRGVVVPLVVGDRIVGVLGAFGEEPTPGLLRVAEEVSRWVSTQIELSELDRSRVRAAEAEVLALRAQISPHFLFNALSAIASFTRTDPDRARELLIEFADFARYSFSQQSQFTTLAEELRNIDRYLTIERARFGSRLEVTLRVAPEVLGVTIPYLVLQPLVENAVAHGLQAKPGKGRVVIEAVDLGHECRITVEDDGVGMDPERLRAQMAGRGDQGSVGIVNIDERLRSVFGAEHGLVIETAPDAGTKVTVRVPKLRAGVLTT